VISLAEFSTEGEENIDHAKVKDFSRKLLAAYVWEAILSHILARLQFQLERIHVKSKEANSDDREEEISRT
tara:strand:- start:823 stop:1035 length:213 start_codon:yes stop_codon:yes gene_type:complete